MRTPNPRTALVAALAVAISVAVACSDDPDPQQPGGIVRSTPSSVTATTPVSTPAAAAATPAATAFPFPEDGCPSPAQIEYMATLLVAFFDLSDAYEVIGDRLNAAIADVDLMDDQAWRVDIAVALAVLHLAADDLEVAQPPDDLVHIHEGVVELAGIMRESSRLIAEGLDELDAAKINAANDLMLSSHDVLARIMEQGDAICS